MRCVPSVAQFDKHWIGESPDRDLFVIGLNEGVKGSLLKDACVEVAPVHSIKFHRHPKTKTFLGAATVSFVRAGSGRLAASELDGKIVGGCYLRAELDDSGGCTGENTLCLARAQWANKRTDDKISRPQLGTAWEPPWTLFNVAIYP